MDKEEFANLFVENNFESIKDLLKKAYVSGYEQGKIDSLTYNIDISSNTVVEIQLVPSEELNQN